MKVYLAGGHGLKSIWLKRNYFDFYRLESFEYLKRNKTLLKYIHKYRDFILDSGVFSFLTSKKNLVNKIDWEEYVYNYAKFVRENKIKNYVEVDLDKFLGLDLVEKFRFKLEKQVGWKSIPVWHVNRGFDYWIKMCKEYDYIAFGAFITDGLKREEFYKIGKFIRIAEENNTKVHGLGFTDFYWAHKLKFYSVDSSSWVAGDRYGFIVRFENGKMKYLRRNKNQKIENRELLNWHNFLEWMKFVNYAEKYL